LVLDPWQEFVLERALGERPDGQWAAPTVGLVVARQNGKNAILEARELAGLFVFGEMVIIHSAHEQATASEQFRRVLRLIETVPEFDRRVMKIVRGKGSEAVELKSGQRILFKTRTGGGGLGFSVDTIVFDEAMILSSDAISALIPTMSARSMNSNTQTWYTGSAVDQLNAKHDGLALARLRERGIAGVPRVAYFEWSAPGDDPMRVTDVEAADPDVIRRANPGYEIRISREWVEHERTVEMGAREYAVHRLGVGDWPDTSEDSGRIIPRDMWAGLAERDRSNRIASLETFGVDTNTDQTWASIGVAGRRADDRWQVGVVRHDRGKAWVVPACLELLEAHPEARIVVDPRGPAANLIPDLVEAGIEPLEPSTQEYGTACADFVAAVVEDRLRYPFPQPELSDAVADARKQALGDRWKWSRRNSTSADISPLVAATLALWGAQSGATAFTTVMFASDEREPEPEMVGARGPVILTQADVTTCFRCATGSPCPIHDP